MGPLAHTHVRLHAHKHIKYLTLYIYVYIFIILYLKKIIVHVSVCTKELISSMESTTLSLTHTHQTHTHIITPSNSALLSFAGVTPRVESDLSENNSPRVYQVTKSTKSLPRKHK